jgi:sugar diacid utilization regulator
MFDGARSSELPMPEGRLLKPRRPAARIVAERQVSALAELSRTMVSGADYEQVLRAVIEKVAKILSATGGGFMLYNESSKELVLQKPAFGVDNEDLISLYRIPLTRGGNAASVFVTGQPYFTNDAQNDPHLLNNGRLLYNAHSILTVPLRVEGKTIGVHHSINKIGGDFTSGDVELMQLLAPQLAVIIQSADLMRELRQRERSLEGILENHSALLAMAVERNGMSALVERLSELVQMPIVVMDQNGTVYAASRATLPTSPAVVARLRQEISYLAPIPAGAPPARLVDVGDCHIAVLPIAAGNDLLGALAAQGAPRRFDNVAIHSLQQASSIFALEIVKEAEIREAESRFTSDILNRLVAETELTEASRLLRQLVSGPSQAIRAACLVIVGSGNEASARDSEVRQLRLHRLLNGILIRSRPGSACISQRPGSRFILLFPVEDIERDDEASALEGLLHELDRSWLFLPGETPIVGVGGVARTALEARRSIEEANMVIAASRALERHSRVIFVEQLGIYRLLGQPVEAADVDSFVNNVLGKLLAYDHARQSDWIAFLERFVACNFSPKAAAKELRIHSNTARYRARRIEEILGRDFDVPDDRLDIQLALKIIRTRDLKMTRA